MEAKTRVLGNALAGIGRASTDSGREEKKKPVGQRGN